MALSILGFNLGIELMQLFVIALTIPWFILLSQTAAHPWVRRSGAVFAGIASIGWMANRLSGQPNLVERPRRVSAKEAFMSAFPFLAGGVAAMCFYPSP
jgi:hypothetical protein